MPLKSPAYAAQSATTPLAPFTIDRRDPRPKDVADRHPLLRRLPLRPPHRPQRVARHRPTPASRATRSSAASRPSAPRSRSFKVGDIAGVGCMVDSCRTCPDCQDGLEQFCDARARSSPTTAPTSTPARSPTAATPTPSSSTRHFVLRIPDSLDPAGAAPLLCAGITTYSPLRHWKRRPRARRSASSASAASATWASSSPTPSARTSSSSRPRPARPPTPSASAPTRSSSRKDDDADGQARRQLRLHPRHRRRRRTTSTPTLNLLNRDGTLCLVGAPEHPHPSPSVFNLIFGAAASPAPLIGGIAETQEMLDFCAQAQHRLPTSR